MSGRGDPSLVRTLAPERIEHLFDEHVRSLEQRTLADLAGIGAALLGLGGLFVGATGLLPSLSGEDGLLVVGVAMSVTGLLLCSVAITMRVDASAWRRDILRRLRGQPRADARLILRF
jgi:hypothetical protein